MKVILIEDVKGVGKKGELLDASDGHARNYLLPKKLAVEASKENMNKFEQQKKNEENKRRKELADANETAEKLSKINVRIGVKSGENGKLFGSVTSKEIAQALEEQTGLKIDKKKINLVDPIKTTGQKTVEIKLHTDVAANLIIDIYARND